MQYRHKYLELAMTAGIWLSLALAALIGEFLSGTFYLLVFSASFAIASLASFFGAAPAVQLILASISALVGVAFLRRHRKRLNTQTRARVDDPDLGQRVEILHIDEARQARVQYRGTCWDAEVRSPRLTEGQHAYIVGRDGNRLIVDTTPPEENA
ncbi:hypothetical protein GQF02_12530 [Neisseriaceae bacterium B2N2-7]|uniref:NfeD-like C-terminal domain-containing protein n=2 Tax=Craterilacuibacter sinensis TaxID=2686017 RepID=A0A845BQX1_9NEIS|nr:hypothetical protein [Craterilacuibacter sinensis]